MSAPASAVNGLGQNGREVIARGNFGDLAGFAVRNVQRFGGDESLGQLVFVAVPAGRKRQRAGDGEPPSGIAGGG
jgi:hypothetical protein